MSQPALFFQIAAGLIPLLLAATGLNDVFRSRSSLSGAAPQVSRLVLVAVVAFVVCVVLAEFIAIGEAVAAPLVPSAFRLTFVAAVIGAEQPFSPSHFFGLGSPRSLGS